MGIEIIKNSVCDFYNLKKSDINTRCRDRHLVQPRQIIMYLAIKHLKYTRKRAGEIYNRDHATAVHANKVIKNLIETDIKFSKEIDQIETLIYQKEVANCLEITHVDLLELSINYTRSQINL